MICILMGVSGSGKSTIGRLLSQRIGWPFFDGDDFHPVENIEKMRAGIPLTDADRLPWLTRLRERMREVDGNAIFACSGLKQSYREFLGEGVSDLVWVYLKGNSDLLQRRMEAREGHFMGAEMLRSQLETLEEPTDALIIGIDRDPGEIVEVILTFLRDVKFQDTIKD
jgi:carbohydrate kinase (thermoresistant glucokinase family)